MRILIAEDDRSSRIMLEKVLAKWGHEVVATQDGEEALRALTAEDPPRLAILDWMMPDLDGVEVCQRLREKEWAGEHYTYVILLTTRREKTDVVAGMTAGADDYVVKPFDQQELRMRVRAGQRIVELQSALIAAKEEVEKLSRIDPLTGVWNRRAFLAELAAEMSRASRGDDRLGLSLLDIDYFKNVNDTYGHLTGDAVLRECVERITASVRPYDSVGRFGGEEFLVLLPGTGEDEVLIVGERIRHAIAQSPFDVGDEHIEVTVSQGVAIWDGKASVDDLIGSADTALYRAKDSGRNRVERA